MNAQEKHLLYRLSFRFGSNIKYFHSRSRSEVKMCHAVAVDVMDQLFCWRSRDHELCTTFAQKQLFVRVDS